MRGGPPARIGDLLGSAGRALGLDAAAESGRIWRRWSEIVGASVAAHAEPTSLRRGILRVRADSPAWCTEIGYLAEEIKAQANRVAGRDVVVEVRVWSGPGAVTPRRPAQPRPPEEEAAAGPAPESPQEALEAARRAWFRRRSGRGSGRA